MPTLREQVFAIVAYLRDHPPESYGEQCARDLERMMRQSWPAERVYIPPANSPYDPDRTEAIRQAAARLPTGVVAQRFGVSRQAVYKLARKK